MSGRDDDMTPRQREVVKRFSAMAGKPTEHRHILVTIYRRRWQDLFRKSHEIRCWTCPVIVREPQP